MLLHYLRFCDSALSDRAKRGRSDSSNSPKHSRDTVGIKINNSRDNYNTANIRNHRNTSTIAQRDTAIVEPTQQSNTGQSNSHTTVIWHPVKHVDFTVLHGWHCDAALYPCAFLWRKCSVYIQATIPFLNTSWPRSVFDAKSRSTSSTFNYLCAKEEIPTQPACRRSCRSTFSRTCNS